MKIKGIFLLFIALIGLSSFSEAQPRHARHHDKHHSYHHHQSRHKVKHYRRLPSGYVALPHRGVNYFYSQGYYYRPQRQGYVRVRAPHGLRVHSLPPGYRKRMYRGNPYYYSRNVYYRQASPGIYIVIGRPW